MSSGGSAGLELRVGNKYRLGRKIGSGSFGDIYLGASRCRSNGLMIVARVSPSYDWVERNETVDCVPQTRMCDFVLVVVVRIVVSYHRSR